MPETTTTGVLSVLPTTANASSSLSHCQGVNQHVALTFFLCLVFFIGFLLNIFSLWVFCCRFPCWTSGTILQFHLALSDAIATPVTPMMAVYFAVGNDWIFGRFMCQVKIALLSSHFYGSSIFLTLISIHRYTTVVHYNKGCCIKKKLFVQKLCACVWCLLGIQAIIFAILLPPSSEKGNSHCLSIHQKNLTDSYFIINFILFIIGFLLPFSVSAICYGRLANKLTTLNVSTAKGLKVRLKSQRMIGICLLIFCVCFLPLNVSRTLGVVFKKFYPQKCRLLQGIETAYYTTWILGGVNSCLDPILYCFGSQNFRDAFQSLRTGKMDVPNRPNRSESEMTANP
ncbi:PREDICTED: P2Y purinoceptor 2-like [Cyprinodon variegatus]|uniref:P2Y purinoceptor 2-like n=1 Tax=Cyprinodon variegatus TaxID=28743 RepID=UPI00074264D4|nr:PREDICTED: P2Y purinoceptor 2-like [Cyprinodon variegatus]